MYARKRTKPMTSSCHSDMAAVIRVICCSNQVWWCLHTRPELTPFHISFWLHIELEVTSHSEVKERKGESTSLARFHFSDGDTQK
jgi:hypothetical protein